MQALLARSRNEGNTGYPRLLVLLFDPLDPFVADLRNLRGRRLVGNWGLE